MSEEKEVQPQSKAARTAEICERIEKRLRKRYGITSEDASTEQIYQAVGRCVRDDIVDVWIDGRSASQKQGKKCLIYLSAEFLMGRALTNNLVNMGLYEDYAAALESMGVDFGVIEDEEADKGLGNGGLGRLAACFLDSLSTLELPAMGYGIRYEYGLFRQEIEHGRQVEVPDDWDAEEDVWQMERSDRMVEVRFGGHVEENWDSEGHLQVEYHDYQSVYAVPHDMPVVGYKTKCPATLRLWAAQAPKELDLISFNQGDYAAAAAERELAEAISKVLYPEDSHSSGKELRLRQFYFLVSATMQSVIYSYKKRNPDDVRLQGLPDKIAVQINDTHPALSIPEFIRILIDNEGLTWEEAVDLATRTFNYTNHTIMPEALEKWPADVLRNLVPRIYRIIETIDARVRDRIWQQYPGDADRIARMSIINGGEVRMANLCVLMCGHTNGVSQLHGRLLRTSVFRDFYALYPERFSGITNGITQRRWLAVANPQLNSLVDETIGEGFLKDWTKLAELAPFADDSQFRSKFAQVKVEKKIEFVAWLEAKHGLAVDPDSIIDVQAKRLHEYKRQLLKVLHILSLYDGIVSGRIQGFPKTTFVFAAKAAPGYRRAKDIIRLINAVAQLIADDERTRDVIPVVFVPNYDVTTAQRLIPAADISEQISTAGLEASGTGNMKFMMNGALTIGTMDGANIEMLEQAGEENLFIFGARVEDLDRLKQEGYYPRGIAEGDPRIGGALYHLIDGSLPTDDGTRFEDIYYSLCPDNGGDQYFVLHDFDDYDRVFFQAIDLYANNHDEWLRRAVINTAKSGFFSSDRAIREYNDTIWHLDALE